MSCYPVDTQISLSDTYKDCPHKHNLGQSQLLQHTNMCSDCGAEPVCSWCGDTCYGTCDDPDTCQTCWTQKNDPLSDDIDDDFDDNIEDCIDCECRCQCHKEFFMEMGIGPSSFSLNEDGTEIVRKGVFPFLSLPLEIRENIYVYAFLQSGHARSARYHRGTIHTALLGTCRQVYHEASQLPFSLNRPCFGGCVAILDFLGFGLTPKTQKSLSSVNLELHPMASHDPNWALALKRLNTLNIHHLVSNFLCVSLRFWIVSRHLPLSLM